MFRIVLALVLLSGHNATPFGVTEGHVKLLTDERKEVTTRLSTEANGLSSEEIFLADWGETAPLVLMGKKRRPLVVCRTPKVATTFLRLLALAHTYNTSIAFLTEVEEDDLSFDKACYITKAKLQLDTALCAFSTSGVPCRADLTAKRLTDTNDGYTLEDEQRVYDKPFLEFLETQPVQDRPYWRERRAKHTLDADIYNPNVCLPR
jgi:hypothetical protein